MGNLQSMVKVGVDAWLTPIRMDYQHYQANTLSNANPLSAIFKRDGMVNVVN
jgi:hypothetical protein